MQGIRVAKCLTVCWASDVLLCATLRSQGWCGLDPSDSVAAVKHPACARRMGREGIFVRKGPMAAAQSGARHREVSRRVGVDGIAHESCARVDVAQVPVYHLAAAAGDEDGPHEVEPVGPQSPELLLDALGE